MNEVGFQNLAAAVISLWRSIFLKRFYFNILMGRELVGGRSPTAILSIVKTFGTGGCAIALIAFAIGQIFPGLGVAFVALTSTAWVAYSASRNAHRR